MFVIILNIKVITNVDIDYYENYSIPMHKV